MALWHYICFGGYQEHDTNEHGRGEIVQSLYGYQGPLSPGNLMSKFTRCSHPFLLIYISSFASQRNRRHPQPIIPAPRMFFQHLGTSFTLSLSRPILVHSSIHPYRRPSSAKFEVQDRTRFPSPTETPLARAHFPSPCYIWQLDVRSRGEFECQQVYIPVLVPCSARGRGQPMQARHRVFNGSLRVLKSCLTSPPSLGRLILSCFRPTVELSIYAYVADGMRKR